jgi:hypothetical protein
MSTDDPDDLHDQFARYVAAFEEREAQSVFDTLPQSGISLPPPDELDDEALTRKLWEVIHGLSLMGTYLLNTNHLSDRELYTELWSDVLREPMVLMPEDPTYSCHIDLVGSGSEEHIHLYLKHYADEEYRKQWLKDWPSDPMPDHEDPPCDRDRCLPQADWRRDGPAM